MLFKLKSNGLPLVRLRVTPDPDQAALLQQKMNALNYHPANGFHRDVRQGRQLRCVPRQAR